MARQATQTQSLTLAETVKALKAQIKTLQQEKQALEKSWKNKLIEAIEHAYNLGYNDSLDDQTALDEEFEEYMEKAAVEFEKQQLKKLAEKPKKAKSKTNKKTNKKV